MQASRTTMFDTRRADAKPTSTDHSLMQATTRPKSQNANLSDYGQQTSIRLATELAEDGNFIDASLVATHFRRTKSSKPSLEVMLADKLISRNVAASTAASGSTVIALRRQNGKIQPSLITRDKSGALKSRNVDLQQTGIDVLELASDGKTIVYTAGKKLTIVKTSNQERIRTDGHDTIIRLVATSDDGSIITSYGDDSLVRIWDGQTGTPLTSMQLRDVGNPYLSMSPSGSIICMAVGNGPAKYINLKGEAEPYALRPRGTYATAICPLPDGRAFVVGCQDGTTRIMEMKMGRESAILEGDGSAVTHVTASPDGRRILAQTRAGRISVYETAKAVRTHIWQLSSDARNIQAIFTANDYIALPKSNTSVDTIALNESDIWQNIDLPKVEITDALLCVDDQILLCGDTSGRLTKISTTTGEASTPVQSHRRRIQNMRVHPTNSKLVTIASWDTTASIFDVASLEPVMMFTGHADRVRDAMLSANGLTIVTVSDDRTCRFWDARTGKQLYVATLQERPLAIESCTNDGATVIDIQGSRITFKRGVSKPVSVQQQRFVTAITAVRTNGFQAIYLAGSQVVISNAMGNPAKSLTSSDQITACYANGMSQILVLGANTGNVQIWDTATMTKLIDAQCASCKIAALGYSKTANIIYVLGVDGHVKFIRFGGRQL